LLGYHKAPQAVVDWCFEYALYTCKYENDKERDGCLLAIKESPNLKVIHKRLSNYYSGILRQRRYSEFIEPILGPRPSEQSTPSIIDSTAMFLAISAESENPKIQFASALCANSLIDML
jgi:hypothetical protein